MRTGFNSELEEEDEDPEELEEEQEEEDPEELEEEQEEEDPEELKEEENPKELEEEEENPEELAEEDPEEVDPEEEDPEELEEEEDPEELEEDPEELAEKDLEEEDPEELEEEEDPEELEEDSEELEEDSEELEEDPKELEEEEDPEELYEEEDPEELEEEEDPEELAEEDLEEEDPEENPSEEYASRPCSKHDTSETDHSGLGERNRSGDLTAFGSTVERLQNKTNRNNQRHSKWDLQPKQEGGNSGKRRRSRWDIQEDCKTGEGSSKKQKTRWERILKTQKLVLLPDFKDPKTKDLQARLIEINSKLQRSELQDEKMRQQLMEARHTVISKMIEIEYHDNAPKKLSNRVYIPVEKFPDYNFIGLILGPRGNTQKRMEKETGALIKLRGKGSGSKQNNKLLDTSDNDELHVYIESDKQNSLDKAVAMVEKLLIPFPLENNELKRAQLEELVRLEATCSVCKEKGHKAVLCPQRQSGFHTAIQNPQNKAPDANDAKLYVGYLPHSISEYRLRELFSPFGKIISASVVMDRNTGLSKGYGFVNFGNPEEASAAIAHMNGYQMKGHRLAVRVAGCPPGTGPTAVATSPQFPGDPDYVSSSPSFGAQFPGDPDYIGSSSFMHFNHSPSRFPR